MSSSTTNTMNVAADGGGGPVPYPKRWAAAFVMILAALLDMIDGSIVNTALPSIGKGLKATPPTSNGPCPPTCWASPPR